MIHNDIVSGKLSRGSFLSTTAVLTTGAFLPAVLLCQNSHQVTKSTQLTGGILNSKCVGIQIGTITYSFRCLKDGQKVPLNTCVEAGLSSIELLGTGVEEYLGASRIPRCPLYERNPLTSEEKIAIEQYERKLTEWRKTKGTPKLYSQLRKKFNDRGVNIHLYRWLAETTCEEIDYSFKVAKALGTVGYS